MIHYLKTKCTVRPLGFEGRFVLEAGAEVLDLAYEPTLREWHLYAVGPEGLGSFVAKRKPRLEDRGEGRLSRDPWVYGGYTKKRQGLSILLALGKT